MTKQSTPAFRKNHRRESGISTTSLEKQLTIPVGIKSLHLKIKMQGNDPLNVDLDATDPHDQMISRHRLHIEREHGKSTANSSTPVPTFKEFISPRWKSFRARIKKPFQKQSLSLENNQKSPARERKVENWLFILAIGVYLITRLISLPSFPIYFFSDEAVQTVLAGDFVRDGLRNYDKELLPTYFVNGNQYNLSTSVYLQIIPYLLLGKSIWVTRGTAVLTTLMAAFAVGLILKNIFESRYYWIATLLLSIIPAWFLHSRTAFETALAVSFFAVFIYFYLMYRYKNPKYIYAAVVMAALCFYSYSPAQMVMAVMTVALWFSDLRYHWQHKKTILIALGVILVTAIPYVRFLIVHAGENYEHLLILRSYWVSDLTFGQKLLHFLKEYARGLNPLYWFFPNSVDLARHLMKGYGHILPYTLPIFLTGLIICMRKFRQSACRVLLFALLAAPAGAALVELGITRALFMVIPVALITALGLHTFFTWLEHFRVPRLALALPVFTILAAINGYMLWDALKNGPIWYQDYGLGGMQYGASQVFGEAKAYLEQNPESQVIISPIWTNGTNEVARFFFPDPVPVHLAGMVGYLEREQTIGKKDVFVATPDEFTKLTESDKITGIEVKKILPYPNGKPGFYFLTMRYTGNAAEIFAAERALRHVLVTEPAILPDGRSITVSHSQFDMGSVADLFDGKKETVTRTLEANPMKIDLDFDSRQALNGVTIRVGGVKSRVTVTVYPADEPAPVVFSTEKQQTVDPRDVSVSFNRTILSERVDIEILSVNDSEPAHVHVWEVTFW